MHRTFQRVGTIHYHHIAAQLQAVLQINSGNTTVGQYLWAQQTRHFGHIIGEGLVEAFIAKIALHVSAIGVGAVKAQLLATPAHKYQTAIGHNLRLQVMAEVIAELLDIGAVILHAVQQETGDVVVLGGDGAKLGFAFIEQDFLTAFLAVGAENNAAVGQVAGADIVTFFGFKIGTDDAAQNFGGEVILPDIPSGLILIVFVQIRVERCAHGK